jgi:hypothetical protein
MTSAEGGKKFTAKKISLKNWNPGVGTVKKGPEHISRPAQGFN